MFVLLSDFTVGFMPTPCVVFYFTWVTCCVIGFVYCLTLGWLFISYTFVITLCWFSCECCCFDIVVYGFVVLIWFVFSLAGCRSYVALVVVFCFIIFVCFCLTSCLVVAVVYWILLG